jgi:ferrochelatase
MAPEKHGIILCNMGGPETVDDVRPFLYNLFSDRAIIRLGPAFMQKVLAFFISWHRSRKSRLLYQQIGGGSPLRRITTKQAMALERELCKEGDFRVTIAMRYWPPYAAQAIGDLLAEGVESLTAITLYPHYSRATTGSSFTALCETAQKLAPDTPLYTVGSWPEQPQYIEALSDNIQQGMQLFTSEPPVLLYSAHSLPVSFIAEGDPYVDHINQTIAALKSRTGLAGRLAYQSRSGPVEWLSPTTPAQISAIAAEGHKGILVVPISFVSDHVETLHEIDIEYKQFAAGLGIRLERSPSLNCHPLFIKALQNLALSHSHQPT